MLKNDPRARLAVYAALVIVSGLEIAHVINANDAGRYTDIINTIVPYIGLGGGVLAATTVARQKANGTLDIPGGSPAEQIAAAVRNYAAAQESEATALDKALESLPPGPTADAIRSATRSHRATITGYQPDYQQTGQHEGQSSYSDTPADLGYAEPPHVVTFCGDTPRR